MCHAALEASGRSAKGSSERPCVAKREEVGREGEKKVVLKPGAVDSRW